MTSGSSDSIHVLHVDDEPDLAEVTAEFIERYDERFDIVTTTSASDGVDRLTQNEFDCIVSDYDMPGQNGIEFLQAVREDYPDLPFILYTGKGSEEVASKAISSGVTDYLQKGSGTSQYQVLANRITNAVSQFHTARELTRSQDLLEHTERLADVGGWEADVETGEQRWTEGTYEIHDIDPDSDFEPTVDAGVGAFHPDDRDEIERRVERCMEQGEPYDVELRLVTADDRLRWVRATGKPIRKAGDIVRIRGAIQDITEHKEREQEITRLNHLYQTVLSNIRETVLVTDDDGQFTYICPNVQFIFGYDAEEVAELGTVEALFGERLIEPDVLEANGDITNIETTITGKGGDSHTVLVTVRQVDIEDGTRLYSVRDITERKEHKRDLQETNQRLQAVLDTVEAAIIIKDTEGRYQLVNQECRRLLGRDAGEEIIGQTDGELFPDDIATRFRKDDQRVLEQEETIEIEEEVPTPDGTQTNLTLKSPFYDDDGELAGICAVSTDVTERKKQREKIQRQNERFDELASTVSHDLQTPLATARGRAKLAVETGDTEQMQKALDALDRTDELLTDLVEVLRRKEIVGETEPVDIEQIGRDVWDTVTTQDDASLEIRDAPSVEADPDALRRLSENLFSNALEHGKDDVTVRIGTTDGGFFIEDDGPGIPEDERDDVFKPGYSTKRDGSGVGLASVREIVMAHDWDIRVTDGPEGGTRFEITSVNIGDQ